MTRSLRGSLLPHRNPLGLRNRTNLILPVLHNKVGNPLKVATGREIKLVEGQETKLVEDPETSL